MQLSFSAINYIIRLTILLISYNRKTNQPSGSSYKTNMRLNIPRSPLPNTHSTPYLVVIFIYLWSATMAACSFSFSACVMPRNCQACKNNHHLVLLYRPKCKHLQLVSLPVGRRIKIDLFSSNYSFFYGVQTNSTDQCSSECLWAW